MNEYESSKIFHVFSAIPNMEIGVAEWPKAEVDRLYVSRMTEWLCFSITSFNRIQFGLTIYNESNIIQSMDSMQKFPLVALSAQQANAMKVENLVGCKPSRLWFSQHGITFTSKIRRGVECTEYFTLV